MIQYRQRYISSRKWYQFTSGAALAAALVEVALAVTLAEAVLSSKESIM